MWLLVFLIYYIMFFGLILSTVFNFKHDIHKKNDLIADEIQGKLSVI